MSGDNRKPSSSKIRQHHTSPHGFWRRATATVSAGSLVAGLLAALSFTVASVAIAPAAQATPPPAPTTVVSGLVAEVHCLSLWMGFLVGSRMIP